MEKQSGRFHKSERLKKLSVIRKMFDRKGESVADYPLRLIWVEMENSSPFPIQFALSVPKRNFAKAVHRNRIRRQIREAYRLNKHMLYQELSNSPRQFGVMLLFTGKETIPYPLIEKKLHNLLQKFIGRVKEPSSE